MKYRCSKCMYEFDEDIEGENFEDLPEDWRCPECGGQIYYFEKDEESISNYFEEKRKKTLKDIAEFDKELKTENNYNQNQNPNEQKIITKAEIAGIIALIIFGSLFCWGFISFAEFFFNNM